MNVKAYAAIAVLVLAAGASGAQETTRFLAGAASVEGVNSTFWVTDARVFNPDPEIAITVNLAFLESDTDNSGAAELSITVQPRQAVALDDLVASLFATSGAGGVRLRSSMPFLAASRTYNTGDGSSGTFGQFIPGLSPDQALQQGILLQVANDPIPSGFRSNVGFVNPGQSAVEVTVRVFDADTATLLGEGSRTLPPLAFSQINNVFAFVGATAVVARNATVELVADGPVLAYASVVDNTSGDPFFVLPEADSGTPSGSNNPPEGTILEPAGAVTVAVGQAVGFTAAVSDPDGDQVTGLEWDFGDGISASGLSVSHTYAATGSYSVTFTATDEHGLDDPTPASRAVTVTEAAATFSEVQQQIFNTSCAFSGCHGQGSASSGMNLDPGSAWSEIVDVPSVERPALDRVEPSAPDSSYLWLKVMGDPSISGSQMPRGGPPLTQDKLDLLRSWIEAGAQNN